MLLLPMSPTSLAAAGKMKLLMSRALLMSTNNKKFHADIKKISIFLVEISVLSYDYMTTFLQQLPRVGIKEAAKVKFQT